MAEIRAGAACRYLWPGLFSETLPAYLHLTHAFGASEAPVSFLHIDCDLYGGALTSLSCCQAATLRHPCVHVARMS